LAPAAILAAGFLVLAAIHVDVGRSSVHLLLTGFMAVLLGRLAILPVAVGVVLQAVLLGHGGLVAAGANVLIIGLPAMLVGAVAQPRWRAAAASQRFAIVAAATVGTYVMSVALLLGTVGVFDAAQLGAAYSCALAHVPVMLIDAGLSGVILALAMRHMGAESAASPATRLASHE
jgi:cobalt/nickel transport system permease protein